MLELTESARKELDAYFAGKEKATIRIYQAGGWGGPRLGLALDEPNERDVKEDKDGFTFCMDKDLLGMVKGVKVDLSYMGFVVEPEVALAAPEGGGCSSCGSSCSTN